MLYTSVDSYVKICGRGNSELYFLPEASCELSKSEL